MNKIEKIEKIVNKKSINDRKNTFIVNDSVVITNRYDKYLPEVDLQTIKGDITISYYEAEDIIKLLSEFIKRSYEK